MGFVVHTVSVHTGKFRFSLSDAVNLVLTSGVFGLRADLRFVFHGRDVVRRDFLNLGQLKRLRIFQPVLVAEKRSLGFWRLKKSLDVLPSFKRLSVKI